VEMPSWLRWLFGAKSSAAKADDLQNVRRQTDQKLKREKAEKQQADARDVPGSRRGDEPAPERPDDSAGRAAGARR
jgi:hypothetical protein